MALTVEFWKRLDEISKALKCDPLHLLNVMLSESGVDPAAHNKNGNASGLIQFMPSTLMGLGWTRGHEAFRQLSATDQLEWVLAYFKPYVKHSLDSAHRIYLFTFLPAYGTDPASRADSFVLCGAQGPHALFYRANAILDTDKNLFITVGDLRKRLERLQTSQAWQNLLARRDAALGGVSLAEVQQKLADMGHYKGKVDGIWGPLTLKAVAAALGLS